MGGGSEAARLVRSTLARLQPRRYAWHESEASDDEAAKDWFAAAFHLRWLSSTRKPETSIYRIASAMLKRTGPRCAARPSNRLPSLFRRSATNAALVIRGS